MKFKSIDIQKSAELIKKGALIIDVREKDEFDNFHIENAYLIPLSQISSSKILEINPDKEIILIHCKSGVRSKQAAKILADQNYPGEIFEMDKGIIGWITNNQSVITQN
tara:strand:- start:149 stop:475 length:327 start_codon:yes stop_codon:yes gene_type:complete